MPAPDRNLSNALSIELIQTGARSLWYCREITSYWPQVIDIHRHIREYLIHISLILYSDFTKRYLWKTHENDSPQYMISKSENQQKNAKIEMKWMLNTYKITTFALKIHAPTFVDSFVLFPILLELVLLTIWLVYSKRQGSRFTV